MYSLNSVFDGPFSIHSSGISKVYSGYASEMFVVRENPSKAEEYELVQESNCQDSDSKK